MLKTGFLLLAALIFYVQTPTPQPLKAGDTRMDPAGIEQVWVPAGCFQMGTTPEQTKVVRDARAPAFVIAELPSEQPQHEVCLTSGYWIDRTEVTHAAFQAFVDEGGYTKADYWSEKGWDWLQQQSLDELPVQCIPDATDDQPRVCVTWYEAEAYANWRGGSLPTEAQWEYAARGPESLIYPWGNEWDDALANVVDSSGLTPVGSYPDGASWAGALDMAGNTMEWAQDWLDKRYYQSSPHDDPTGPENGSRKVEKGGWWGSDPAVARSAYRHFEDPPTYQDHHIGFRMVSPGEG
jgi:formylglycine-generating enzyme required for sulfatase activity